MIIKNAQVYGEDFKFSQKDLFIEGEHIAESCGDKESIDAKGLYAIPGLIDIHIHGCYGHDFCEGTPEAIDTMTDYLSKQGITAFTGTTMSLSEADLSKVFGNAGKYKNDKGAMLVGINMEGPFLAPSKKGAQNGEFIIKPNFEMFNRLNDLSGGITKLVTIAPELDSAMEFIDGVKDKVTVSLGHTSADYEVAKKAIQNGAGLLTHMFNGMPPFSHREPGVIGAAFDSENCMVELITDGIHISPPVVRAAFKMFGDERIVLVSDNMMATGMPNGTYELGGQAVNVNGKLATLEGGTIAGSATNLMDCVRTAVSFNIPLESAIRCATANPAKVLKISDEMGSLSTGKYANIVLLDKDLNVVQVIIKGKKVLA